MYLLILSALSVVGVVHAQETGSEAGATAPSTESQADIVQDVDQFLQDAAASAPPPPPPPAAASANAFNPRITAFGDVLTSVGVQDGEVASGSGPWVRSFEMDIRADVDPFAKAVAVFAVEQEPPLEGGGVDNFSAAPEEIYINLVSLPAGFSGQVGKFKQPFGITNRAHPHDWPWPTAPIALANVLGEGLNETGALVDYRVPNPWNKGLVLHAGVNGGEGLDPRGETAVPAWLGRAEYFDMRGNFELGLGASATGLEGHRKQGADLMFRWRKDSWKSVVLLAEAFQDVETGESGPLGLTATLQVQPTREIYIGARVDHMDEEDRLGAFLSYYTTEFLRVRAGAESDPEFAEILANAQLTFVWGSHPVEPYWVNR